MVYLKSAPNNIESFYTTNCSTVMKGSMENFEYRTQLYDGTEITD